MSEKNNMKKRILITIFILSIASMTFFMESKLQSLYSRFKILDFSKWSLIMESNYGEANILPHEVIEVKAFLNANTLCLPL